MGRNDKKDLAEFATGDDVGHGPNHDCPVCRKNRQALKLAGLTAKDIRGLAGKDQQPPAASPETAPPPPPPGQPEQPPVAISPAAAPSTEDTINQVLADNPQIAGEGAKVVPPTLVENHRRMLKLVLDLEQSLSNALQAKLPPVLVEAFNDHEIGIEDLIVEAGGRYMLMNGFKPDDRDWYCEIGFGADRASVSHRDKQVATLLTALIALDPQNGARLNSDFMQLRADEKNEQRANGWSGQSQAV